MNILVIFCLSHVIIKMFGGIKMSKIILIPDSIYMIENTINKVDAYLIGVQDLSINLPISFTIEEIQKISKLLEKNKKELFVSLNKNMFNADIKYLKEVLGKLDKLSIKAIFFYDIALVHLKKKMNLELELVWSQEHFTTNYETINYWYQKGVTYTRISSEITLKEILEIKKNTKSRLIVPIFGYLPMFASKRKLVTNYKKYFSLKTNSNIYYMMEENKKYPIIEDKNGTYVYYSKILNGKKYQKELEKAGIDYLLMNSFLIPNFEEVLSLLLKENTEKEINQLLNLPIDDTVFTKNTIYKVK